MDASSQLVRARYASGDEWGRLVRDEYHRLEFETTLHFLAKHLPKRGRVLDAGGGPGRYAIELAKNGHQVVLFDLTPGLLDIARREVKRAGLQGRVTGFEEGTIEDLSRFPSRSFDAVLCLGGPLNHLLDPKARGRALDELVRVAKRRAPIVLSVIGRLAVLQVGLVRNPGDLKRHPRDYQRILKTGDYSGAHGFAPCHFFLPEELEALVKGRGLRVVERVGLEGLAAQHRPEVAEVAKKHPRAWKSWKKIHFETCTLPAVVAISERFLFVCRKG